MTATDVTVSSRWDACLQLARDSAPDLDVSIRALAAIGGGPDGSVTRLAFTPSEREAHAMVGGWLTRAGLRVHTDTFGNTIGVLGVDRDLPAIVVGSHLDSVPVGGRFDGVAGVVVATQVARILSSSSVPLRRPLWVVAFANEEGARFGEPCLGSKAVAGVLEPADANRLRDVDGTTLADAMTSLGFDPARLDEARWSSERVAAFLELHVEQGRVLEDLGCPIGLVDAVAGSARIRVHLSGRADHSGGTPMILRRDALAGAAEMISLVELTGKSAISGARATVGRLQVSPNNITTVPGDVLFFIDVRDIDPRRLQTNAMAIIDGVAEIAERRDLTVEVEVLALTAPTQLWAWLRELLRQASQSAGLRWHILPSGAGHDAQIIARHLPAAMVFVPSHNGASHVPSEWTPPEQLAQGLLVMLNAVRLLDATDL